jgi:hypothetical protein
MRRGKTYRQLLPYALAPDWPFYHGLPVVVRPNMQVRIGGFPTTFEGDPKDATSEVIPGTWEVRYAGRAIAGDFDIAWKCSVFPSENEPGIHVVIGLELNDGSIAVVENYSNYFESNVIFGDAVVAIPPWRAEAYDGVITFVNHFYLFAVPRKLEP